MIQALYIHIPFCTSRCSYCDFVTSACHDDAVMDAYIDALQLQIRRAAKAGLLGGVKTIYIGGGTPTHLGARRLNSLLYMVSLSITLENVAEYTVEANPESLDARMVKDLYALGVDRISLGAQSFDDAVLSAYGRAHGAAAIAAAVAAIKERDVRFSLDLICGGPGQTRESWINSIKAALGLGAQHVSVYPLSVEDGTPLAARVEAGEWNGPDEDEQAAMMQEAQVLLEAAGLQRYEVASYAVPGQESQHNTAYWTGVEYLGLGAAASSMLGAQSWSACRDARVFGEVSEVEGAPLGQASRIRMQTSSDVASFSASLGRPGVQLECMTEREAVLEDTMLAFRRSAGLGTLLKNHAVSFAPELSEVLEDLQAKGLIAVSPDGSLRPTERGWLMGNEIFGAIWGLA